VRIGDGLALKPARFPAWPAALLLGVSLWPFAYEIFVTQDVVAQRLWPNADADLAGGAKLEFAKALLARFENASPLAVLLCMAVVPGIFEELFFRGYLYTALAKQRNAWMAIALSALLFAGFHVISGGLTDERFLPSLFIGLILGYLRWQSGSVLPGMMAHACHNGLLLAVVMYRDRIDLDRWFATEQRHLPALWLVGAAFAAATAIGLAALSRRRPAPPSEGIPIAAEAAASQSGAS
jgi:ABC-2 type transport system permease protein/sodium transport system permease protein